VATSKTILWLRSDRIRLFTHNHAKYVLGETVRIRIVGIIELYQDLFVLSQLAFSASAIRLTNPSQAWTYLRDRVAAGQQRAGSGSPG
jgi:hypothetical protein